MFLLDTQAQISILKPNNLDQDIKIRTKDSCGITGVTDGRVQSLGATTARLFLSNSFVISQEFQVVNSSFPIPVDGILGQDFLWGFKCTICTMKNVLTVRTFDAVIDLEISNPHSDEIWIPPRCQVIHKVRKDFRQDMVIRNEMLKPGVFVAGTICSSDPHVLVLNTNTQMERIKLSDIHADCLDNYRIFSFASDLSRSQRVTEIFSQLNFSHVPSSAVDSLKDLCSKYNDVFHLPNDSLTTNNFYTQDIHLTDEIPVFKKNFRIPEAQKAEISKQVKDLLDDGRIEPSDSPFNNPIFLIPKKSTNGKPQWRLVVDFRDLNKKILQDRFPLPRIDETLDSLGKAKWFSTLDLQSGFHQVPLSRKSKKYTAFSTTDGHYQFSRLPFGLNISPNSFQRMMSMALSGLSPHIAFLYIDDIIVTGGSEKHHLANLEKVFLTLRKRNLKLNLAKCNFFRKEVLFLGHRISDKGILPDESKIETVKKYPKPINSAEVKRFVAFANYYRRFIKNFSEIAAPLHKLTSKGVNFIWSKECDLAFHRLKTLLSNPPILQYPDFDKKFILVTDASDLGCGAKLAQSHKGVELPIAFSSKAFKGADLNRPPIEKEMLAIYYGIVNFRPYLYGRKFLVRTDHKPLIHMFTMRDPTSKIVRMCLELADYDFEIEYIPGPENVEADAFSRLDFDRIKEKIVLAVTRSMTERARRSIDLIDEPNDATSNHCVPVYEALSFHEIKDLPKLKCKSSAIALTYGVRKNRKLIINENLYFNDDTNNLFDLEKFFKLLEKHLTTNNINKIALAQNDDIFRYVSLSQFKSEASVHLKNINIVIYFERRKLTDVNDIRKALTEAHDSILSGHPGQSRMYQFLKKYYTWRNMKTDVKNYVNNCQSCKLSKHGVKTQEKMVITDTPAQPFDVVSVDTVGPLSLTASGNRFILTVQCDFSKYVTCVPIPNKEARTIARALFYGHILHYGAMKKLKTDLGTEYVNEILSSLCDLLKIEKVTSTSYHPQTIGGLERNHRVLNEYLRNCLVSFDLEWDTFVQIYAFAYNVMPNSAHKYSPFELVYGRKANFPLDYVNGVDPLYNHDLYNKELKFRLQNAFSRARGYLLKDKEKRIASQDKVNSLHISVGDKVKLENEQRENKLSSVYLGPYTVVSISGTNCEIVDEKGKRQTVHKNRLKIY